MSKSEGKGSISEWQLFNRIDELEKITLELMDKTESVEPTLKDTAALARAAFHTGLFGFILGFSAASQNIKDRRKFKDEWVEYMKSQGVDKALVDHLHEWMLYICKQQEKAGR